MKNNKKDIIQKCHIPIFNGRLWVFGIMSPYYDDILVNGQYFTIPIGEEWTDEFGKVYKDGDIIFYKDYEKYIDEKDSIMFIRKLSSKAISYKLYENYGGKES